MESVVDTAQTLAISPFLNSVSDLADIPGHTGSMWQLQSRDAQLYPVV